MIRVVRDELRARAPTCKLMVLIRPRCVRRLCTCRVVGRTRGTSPARPVQLACDRRGADFCYSEHERAVMVDDIQVRTVCPPGRPPPSWLR